MIRLSLPRPILTMIPLLLCAASVSTGAVLPTGQWEYEFVYDREERVDVLSLDLYDYQIGPYSFDKQKFSFEPFESLRELPSGNLNLFGFLGEEFRAMKDLRAQGFETLRGGFAAQPVNKLFVYGSFVLDEELAGDESYAGKKWRGLAGDVREAFACFKSGKLSLTAGRFASFWGVRNSLILSRENLFDGFGYTFRWGRLVLSYRLARLDGLNPDKDDVTQFENRYLAAHRLDVHLSGHLRLGVFETVLFGGPGRQIDLFYLNPIIFFHGTQLNEGTNDNTTVGFDFAYKPTRGYKFYGQFLIDDLQIDNESQGDQEPSEIALLLGGYAADIAWDLDLKAEYVRVTNWTFNQMLDRNRYTFGNRLIGSALGNDYDLTSVSVIRWFGDKTAASASIVHYRQGEGRVDAEWTDPWTQVEGDYSEPFPTGVVQKTTSLSGSIKSFVRKFAFLDFEAGVNWVTDNNHVPDDDRTLPYLNLKLSVFFSKSVSVE